MNKRQVINSICEEYWDLPQACKDELYSLSYLVSYKKKDQVVKEGQTNTKLYFVAEGILRAYYLKDGNDITDWFSFTNDFICSIQNFFEELPSQHYIEALEPSTILEISKESVLQLSLKYRTFEQMGYKVTTQTMVRLQKRIVALQFETAHQKYLNLLAEQPDIELKIPLIHIASYLGITIETLSRLRKRKIRI